MASECNNQPPSKKVKFDSEEDRISTLPDEVLIHILSFLSTKMAFTTSLLSSRWEYLWASVPNLYFGPCLNDYNDEDANMNFIDNVLFSHNSSINKFHLKFRNQFDVSRLTAWISAVVKRNVRELVIEVRDRKLDALPLPRCLYTCRTLVTLKLRNFIKIDVPASIHFPCLKVLDISVDSPSTNLTQKLFCSSPVLEELSIVVFGDSGDLIYNIVSPVLKKLSMFICACDIENFDSVAIVDAPVLESLEIQHYCFLRYILKDCVSLIKAHIHVDVDFLSQQALENRRNSDRIFTLLKSVSKVKDLFIDRILVAAFGIASERKLAVFSNVTRLELDVDKDFNYESLSMWSGFLSVTHLKLKVNDEFASKSLSKLLARMPNLVSLLLHKVFNKTSQRFNCSKQEVPSCFRSCLREIEVDGLQGTVSELKLINYLLANAEVLEKMTLKGLYMLWVLKTWKAEGFESQILKMPRCSKACKLLMGWRERELVKFLLANGIKMKNTEEFQ